MNTVPLHISGVHKSFATRDVLKGIDLQLAPGEIFGLIGLNGAGKTTLIKIMLDLINADKGSVEMMGIPTKNINARKQLSYLPEKFQPSRYLRGEEYIQLSLSYYARKYSREEARAMAAALDLDPSVLPGRVGSYSKGMGQKLGLACAFLIDSPFLVLDEPMSGLDPRSRIKLKEQLLASKKKGKTVFFSSHILSDIDEICDRIGILHDGRLQFIGTPAEFKQKYNDNSLEKAFLRAIEVPSAA